MELTGKISTTESLDDAELIWGAAEKSNTAVLIEASGPTLPLITGMVLLNRSLST
jgi:hypothetical protein